MHFKTAEKYLLLITKPSRFFAAALMEQKLPWAVFFVVVMTFIFSLIRVASDRTLPPLLIGETLAKSFPSYSVLALAAVCLYACSAAKLGRLFGGKATFKRIFIVGAYSCAPLVFLASPYTALIGVIWGCCLAVIGLKMAHGIPLLRAVIVQSIFVATFMLLVTALIMMLMGMFKKHYPAEQLVHKPAPDVLLKTFEGQPVMLSSLKGKSVVLLDFWATWCGPCRTSLPILAEVAHDFRERGVEVYAISGDADPQLPKDYLQALKIDLKGAVGSAALDSAFFVEALPQTVVIDKNGIVQAVQIGVSPHEKEQLHADLERCLGQ